MRIGELPFWGPLLAEFALLPWLAEASGGAEVLVVVNQRSAVSRHIGEYYVKRRQVPLAQVCKVDVPAEETIARESYQQNLEMPVAACLRSGGREEAILYIVTTLGLPLKIPGHGPELETDAASVDSELAALYGRMRGVASPLRGPLHNPYFMQGKEPFGHPRFPLYLVTRLAGYSFEDVKALIDRSLIARNAGKLILDARADNNTPGNTWLRDAARALPASRVLLENTGTVVYG